MKIVFISDTHEKHRDIILPKGDILIHCGDITGKGSIGALTDFADYIKEQDFKYKIVIAGNHDFCFENERREMAEEILTSRGIIYLNDSGVTINGLNFWGSPVQPWFFNWAFNRQRGKDIKKHWDKIPQNTNVLITHGPPYGILDKCANGDVVGCEELLKKIKDLKSLKIHAYGHIHEGYGVKTCNGVKFVNASSLNHRYQVTNAPIVIDI